MENNFENYKSVKQAIQLARLYNLSCRWASLMKLNIVNILILIELYANKNGLEPSIIADHLFLPRQTMTYAIDTLEHDEYIIRINHKSDRRRKIITLTDKGMNLVTKIMAEIDYEYNNLTENFIKDKKGFENRIDEFIAHIDEKLNFEKSKH